MSDPQYTVGRIDMGAPDPRFWRDGRFFDPKYGTIDCQLKLEKQKAEEHEAILEQERVENLALYRRIKQYADRAPITVEDAHNYLGRCSRNGDVTLAENLSVLETHAEMCWEWGHQMVRAEDKQFKDTCPYGLPQGEKL